MKSILIPAAMLGLIASGAGAHNMLHTQHDAHAHGEGCGHTALDHDGHVDYLHDGHIHHSHDGHTDEHTLEVTSTNPEAHSLTTRVTTDDHMHDHDGEEHEVVQHGAHFDYVHDGRLHHVHGDHMDDHGPVKTMS